MPILEKADQRRWGFEIENREWNRYANDLERSGFSLHTDSSLEYECQCDCDSCEHDCNCSNCDITEGYRDPDHCEESACIGNELVSPVYYEPSPSKLKKVEEYGDLLSSYSWNDDNAGMHIHIEARDLSVSQAQNLLTIWNRFVRLSEQDYFGFFGRHPNNYCRKMDKKLHQASDKMQQVNFQNVFSFDGWAGIVEPKNRPVHTSPYGVQCDTYKTTVEFRGFAPTYHAKVIEERARFCRAVVEYVAQGLPPYWLLRHKTEHGFRAELYAS